MVDSLVQNWLQTNVTLMLILNHK